MIDRPLPPAGEELRRNLRDGVVLLNSVRSTLADILAELRLGNVGPLRELVPKTSDLEAALRRVFETEQKFNDWYAKHFATEAEDEPDYDAIRLELGCRLARLAECCDEGAFS